MTKTLFLASALFLGGCATATLIPQPSPTTPLSPVFHIHEAGRYMLTGNFELIPILDDEGVRLMVCPSGYEEYAIAGTLPGVDAMGCKKKALAPVDTSEIEPFIEDRLCTPPRVITNSGGTLGCADACPPPEVADQDRRCGQPPGHL